MPIRFLDMFAGIGGFRSGLERLGGFECVGYCEIDKYAKQAYDAMYPTKGELYFADARTIDPYTLPDIDLICGGFPCQSFSMIERENATVKAYASVNIGGAFVIKDIAVVDGQKGMFARMPFRSYKGANGETKYSDIAFALTDEARQSLNDAVLGAYREALEESEDELPDEDESPAQSM